MARQREDVDWYVDLSERLERREHRRRWVALALCAVVPLLLIGSVALYAVAQQRGWITSLWGRIRGRPEDRLPDSRPVDVPISNETVAALHRGDIRFNQLNEQGFPTTTFHYFRERKPEKADEFTVNRVDERHGTVRHYRLENVGTTEVYDFSGVAAEKIESEWHIAEQGWIKIRNELQARMNLKLGMPSP
ncbi:MAG: hypothetical protein FJ291_14185 [Planctomycetes bacterium]|nr:hypothetical protein [Planctomycetota bacterium]